MTIPTLTKLLAMRMVPNNSSGLSNHSLMVRWFLPSSSNISCSAALKEKKATSEPEISADSNSSKAKTSKDIATPIEIEELTK